jgi:hypothetical protein
VWGETESTWYIGHCWPIVPAPDDRWWWLWSSSWNEDWQGKPKHSEKTCSSATLSTTNPTWPDLGSNPGRRSGKPATNRLSYGTAESDPYLHLVPKIRIRGAWPPLSIGPHGGVSYWKQGQLLKSKKTKVTQKRNLRPLLARTHLTCLGASKVAEEPYLKASDRRKLLYTATLFGP